MRLVDRRMAQKARVKKVTAIREKKTLDDALKADLGKALKEFQEHFKTMKATA